jgi:hypothetical protein
MADNVQHNTPTLTAQSGSGSAPQVNQAMDTNMGLDLGGGCIDSVVRQEPWATAWRLLPLVPVP